MKLSQEQCKPLGILKFTEPIIVSGEYFGIRLLSAYDFMLCIKMANELSQELILKGFDEKIAYNISEKACVVAMCLHHFNNHKVFNDGLEALKKLTSDELKMVYDEYVKLMKKVLKKNEFLSSMVVKIKNEKVKQN